jgi:hypothetical protein
MVVVAGDDVSEGRRKIDRHAFQSSSSVGDEGRRFDQHAVESVRVLDDRRRAAAVRRRRRSHHGAVQIQNRPRLLTGDGRRFGIEGSGVLLCVSDNRDGLMLLLLLLLLLVLLHDVFCACGFVCVFVVVVVSSVATSVVDDSVGSPFCYFDDLLSIFLITHNKFVVSQQQHHHHYY